MGLWDQFGDEPGDVLGSPGPTIRQGKRSGKMRPGYRSLEKKIRAKKGPKNFSRGTATIAPEQPMIATVAERVPAPPLETVAAKVVETTTQTQRPVLTIVPEPPPEPVQTQRAPLSYVEAVPVAAPPPTAVVALPPPTMTVAPPSATTAPAPTATTVYQAAPTPVPAPPPAAVVAPPPPPAPASPPPPPPPAPAPTSLWTAAIAPAPTLYAAPIAPLSFNRLTQLRGLGDALTYDPNAGADPDPVEEGELDDTGYFPNADVWVSVDPVQLYWKSIQELRDEGYLFGYATRGSAFPPGTPLGVQLTAFELDNYGQLGLQYHLDGRGVPLEELRQPIKWPDGTPLIGRVWLPKTHGDGQQSTMLSLEGVPSSYSRKITVPWWRGFPQQPTTKRNSANPAPWGNEDVSRTLFWFWPGYRYLGTNFGTRDMRYYEGSDFDKLSALIQDDKAGGPWRASGNPSNIPDEMLTAAWGPVASFSGYAKWYNGLFDGPDSGVGNVFYDEFSIAAEFDWSKRDPTSAAYPWLYDNLGPDLIGWDPYRADLWRSDGASVAVRGLPALGIPPWPFNCLEFLSAMVTGEHGVPVMVREDGTLDKDALTAFMAQAPWDKLRASYRKGSAFLMVTIYDDADVAITASASPRRAIQYVSPSEVTPVAAPPPAAETVDPEEYYPEDGVQPQPPIPAEGTSSAPTVQTQQGGWYDAGAGGFYMYGPNDGSPPGWYEGADGQVFYYDGAGLYFYPDDQAAAGGGYSSGGGYSDEAGYTDEDLAIIAAIESGQYVVTDQPQTQQWPSYEEEYYYPDDTRDAADYDRSAEPSSNEEVPFDEFLEFDQAEANDYEQQDWWE